MWLVRKLKKWKLQLFDCFVLDLLGNPHCIFERQTDNDKTGMC